MHSSFYLGIHQLWDTLLVMQNPGMYWLNVANVERARLFCRQTLNRQMPKANVVFISAGEKPTAIVGNPDSIRLKNLSLYTIPKRRQAILLLSEDIMRSMKARNLLLVLYVPAELWKSLTISELSDWLKNMSAWAEQQHITLLIFNHGSSTDILREHLLTHHRELCGLASLNNSVNGLNYEVDFWCNELGVSAKQKLNVFIENDELKAEQERDPEAHYNSDEDLYMAVKTLFSGISAPEHWQLFRDNDELALAGSRAKAATLIFALEKRKQINSLVQQIYNLRRERGNGLKIIVRLLTPNIRANDKNALLSGGANLIVEHTVPPEKLAAEAASIQGELFSRFIPHDVGELLKAINSSPLRGYVNNDLFNHSVIDLINNEILPENNKGVLLAYTPVEGINAEQALTLCKLRRDGDLVTIFHKKLLMFLSNCDINELNSTLRFIFSLPVEQIFSQRQAWHLDRDILAKMYEMRQHLSDHPNPSPAPKISRLASARHSSSPHSDGKPALVPQEITLSTGSN